MFGIDDLLLGGLALGGSLLSGFGASKSAKKQQKMAIALQAQQDAQNQALQAAQNAASSALGADLRTRAENFIGTGPRGVVDAAQKAGFNPVTWLNAGMPALGVDMLKQGMSWQIPGMTQYGKAEAINIPSPLQAIGGAVSSVASVLGTANDTNKKIAAQQSNMQTYLASVALSRMNGNRLAGLGTPAFSMAGPRTTTSSGGALSVNGFGLKDKPGNVTDLTGGGLIPDRSMPDSEDWQTRLGWLPGNVAGVGVAIADTYRTAVGRQLGGDWAYMMAQTTPMGGLSTSGARDAWAARGGYQGLTLGVPQTWTNSGSLSPWRPADGLGYTYGD